MNKYLLLLLIIPSLCFSSQWKPCYAQNPGMDRMETPEGWIVMIYGNTWKAFFLSDKNHKWNCRGDMEDYE